MGIPSLKAVARSRVLRDEKEYHFARVCHDSDHAYNAMKKNALLTV